MVDMVDNETRLPYEEERMNRMTISSIETFFDGLLRGELTDNLFFNDLPTSIKRDWTSLAIVDVGNPMRNNDAYTVGTVLINMYAKQNPYGTKDVRELQRMEQTLNRLILNNHDEHYHLSMRGNYSNYNAVNDIFFDVVQVNLIIT